MQQRVDNVSNELTKPPVSALFLKTVLPNNGTSLFVMTVWQTSNRFDQLHIIYRSTAAF
jgi:hypothetical protein